ncbi:MAG: hypothetical protein K5744_08990, partial [Eubacterium sp.]|nr:hypothetical protein [Eubacterium sp.]
MRKVIFQNNFLYLKNIGRGCHASASPDLRIPNPLWEPGILSMQGSGLLLLSENLFVLDDVIT